MRITFPAMRGIIGQREYFATLMKLSAVPKMFSFRDWAEFTAEDREQRVLNKRRVPDIARYMLDNEDSYLFSSITASYRCEVDFKSHDGSDGSDIGHLEMEFEDANFVINDGQHRCAAITAAITENPDLGDETISVLLFPYKDRDRVQQMFSDLNRFVKKTSKSLDILYDKRDVLSRVTLAVSEKVDLFKGMVDKDAVSIPVRSAKLFTLSALYDANKEMLKSWSDDGTTNEEGLIDIALEYWASIIGAMTDWRRVKEGDMKALELRQTGISSHAVVLRAIGSIGAELMQNHRHSMDEHMRSLSKVDWSKRNPDWEGICIVANSVVSNRQARAATKAYLKRKIGLELTDAEARTLAKPPQDDITPRVKSGPPRGDGHRGNDNLEDYLLPIIKLIYSGKRRSDAYMQVVKELDVTPNTVHSQCTRGLGLSLDEFEEYVRSRRIVQVLKDKFPDRRELIDKEIGG